MTELAILRSRLSSLKHRRTLIRWALAGSALLLTVLLILLTMFVVDWSLELSVTLRIVLLPIGLLLFAWAIRKYMAPHLGRNETLEDMALMVERQQGIDSDLVAALQFSKTHDRNWGSPQLETAVVNYVDEFSPGLNVFEGFSWAQISRRCAYLAVTLLVIALIVILAPRHVETFFQRFLLGSQHYPTRTQILSIEINRQQVIPVTENSHRIQSPYGQPVTFIVACVGELPEAGVVKLKSLKTDVVIEIPLTVSEEITTPQGESGTKYLGTLPKLVDSVSWQLYIGDAWTDPRLIDLIPLPVVSVSLKANPPKYALSGDERSNANTEGALQLSVIEGSSVDFGIRCTNKKLHHATVTIDEKEYPLTAPEDATEDQQEKWHEGLMSNITDAIDSPNSATEIWTLPIAGTPLENVQSAVRYSVQVEDVDGLSLIQPIQGYIALKTDQPPRIGAALMFRRYLSGAKPRIEYGVADDYGISKLELKLQLVRGTPMPDNVPMTTVETLELPLKSENGEPLNMWRDSYSVNLKPYNLQKGDELKITLEAFDERGGKPPESKVSEPLVIQITDRIGLGADLNDAHRMSARQMNTIIQQQLGIGESR